MEITDLIPFLGDTVVFIVLAYVVWLFVDGRILSQKAMERITTAIIVDITTRIDETLAANFNRMSREEQILNEIKGLHSDDEIRQKLSELLGLKRIAESSMDRTPWEAKSDG